MSLDLVVRVWRESTFSGNDLLVLLALADNADDGGLGTLDFAALKPRARIKTIRSIRRICRRLYDAGEIVVGMPPGTHGLAAFWLTFAEPPERLPSLYRHLRWRADPSVLYRFRSGGRAAFLRSTLNIVEHEEGPPVGRPLLGTKKTAQECELQEGVFHSPLAEGPAQFTDRPVDLDEVLAYAKSLSESERRTAESHASEYKMTLHYAAAVDCAEDFFDYFSSNGWKVSGRAPMKNWKAAFRRWVRTENKPNGGGPRGRRGGRVYSWDQVLEYVHSHPGTTTNDFDQIGDRLWRLK